MRGQRKTKHPCLGCNLHPSLCLCDTIPLLSLKTKVTLIIHYKELRRTTNTGSLALKALVNSEMRVRGDSHKEAALDLSDLLTSDYETLLFYPSQNAAELNSEFIASIKKPIQLIVPDGNWRQASKVHSRHLELKDIPRVMISTPNLGQFHLRAESTEHGMSTLEAIAQALGVIEGPGVKAELLKLYETKLQRTLIGRGIKIDRL